MSCPPCAKVSRKVRYIDREIHRHTAERTGCAGGVPYSAMICTAQLARMHRPTARVATQHVAMVSTARRPVHVTPCHGCATFRWRGVHAGDSTALKASERALGAHRSLARRAVTLGSRTCWIEGRKRLSQHRPRGALVRPLVTRALTSNDVDHASYIQDNAAIPAPQLLPMLVKVLEARGQTVLSPADRKGLHPLVVPLSRAAGGDTLTGVLRWPTSAGGDDMPIVEAGPHGLSLLANSCSEYIHRALVEVRRMRYPPQQPIVPRSLPRC